MRRSTIICLTVVAAVSGCDRGEPPPDEQPPSGMVDVMPLTEGSITTARPPTTAPTSAPTTSLMTIGDRMFTFPPARIRLRQDGDTRVAVLYSAKSRNAIDDPTLRGNSYYLPMQLNLTEDQPLSDGRWQYKAPTSEMVDSPDGIFLDGTDKHLQPFDVAVEFEEDSPGRAIVFITGQFLMFEERHDDLPGEFVTVSARLLAETDAK